MNAFHAPRPIVSTTRPGRAAATPLVLLGLAAAAIGAAGPALAQDAQPQMEHCNQTLGVLRIDEDTGSAWYQYYGGRLGSTAPVLSSIIMDSNCFVVVERGTGERSINDETRRARGDEARESDTRGKGQQVVADYLLKPEIVMAKKGTEGSNVALGGLFRGALGGVVGGALGSVGTSTNEANTALTLVDIRSTVRLASSTGSSKNTDFRLAGLAIGHIGAGGSAYSNTDEGKLITAAFVDAYNKLVVKVRSYKAQTVEGGLGEGGRLGVQGGSTRASRAVDAQVPSK
ncbi:MAG: peptidoglycan-binding protein [Proteobacteria bacterium]|nr:peptidoglycan-binding protein [Pseudomonadota bacterium]